MQKKIIIISLLYLYTSSVCAEIYKWVDAQGRVHYGDKQTNSSTEMQINASKKSNVKVSESREASRQRLLDAYKSDNERESKEKEKAKKKKKDLQRRCSYSKDTLKGYERARYLYDLDKDGKRIIMSSEERAKTTSRLKSNIKKYCK